MKVVHSITPNKGSMEGGTTIEIRGEFFGTPSVTKDVWIKVAGIKCKIIQHTRKMIKCITGKADPSHLTGDLFAGMFDILIIQISQILSVLCWFMML